MRGDQGPGPWHSDRATGCLLASLPRGLTSRPVFDIAQPTELPSGAVSGKLHDPATAT